MKSQFLNKFFLSCKIFILIALSACTTQTPLPPPNQSLLTKPIHYIYRSSTPGVGTYISSKRGFETATHWIETPEGIIVIDTQFLLSAAEEALSLIESTTGKKVIIAFVLHPNPDKFNGASVYQKRGIRVVTSESVAKHIPSVYKLRKSWFYERYKPDFPGEEPKVEILKSIQPTGTVIFPIGGTEIKIHSFEKGCSYSHLVIEWNGNLFVGDLVSNGAHAWTELGYIDEWVQILKALKSNKEITRIYPGRGSSDGIQILDRQIHYLQNVKNIAKKSTDEDDLENKILNQMPGLGYEHFVYVGKEAVFNRYKRK